ncbi:hypothetical protein D9758_017133 [Tetrapyrgos nigripes]|uniref:Uncharacterized protein n=1 Tax=Tetrapyrgos nigripes TaxID=182062 RepID=A0A8H5F4U8_9AGAR|nr:hypothetical protein D9758_017133 [Tetrapyrgos nigripes]
MECEDEDEELRFEVMNGVDHVYLADSFELTTQCRIYYTDYAFIDDPGPNNDCAGAISAFLTDAQSSPSPLISVANSTYMRALRRGLLGYRMVFEVWGDARFYHHPETIAHLFFQTDLLRYLQPLPLKPGPVLGTLSALVSSLVHSMPLGGSRLRRDDGIQGNVVQMTYTLLRDKRGCRMIYPPLQNKGQTPKSLLLILEIRFLPTHSRLVGQGFTTEPFPGNLLLMPRPVFTDADGESGGDGEGRVDDEGEKGGGDDEADDIGKADADGGAG